MLDRAGRDLELAEFLVDHLLGVSAEDHVQLVLRAVEVMEETLQIEGAACSGCGKDEAHLQKEVCPRSFPTRSVGPSD
jgi:hypothetical protein